MKKWIDYLFEPEPVKPEKPEEQPEEPKPAAVPEKPEPKAEQPETKPEETKPAEAAQPARKHSGSFINLEELQVKKPENKEDRPKKVEADPKPYESHPTISPIFGYLDGEKPKDFVLHTPQIKTDTGSLLGTIYSPYYGVMKQDYRTSGKHSAPPKEAVIEPEPVVEKSVRPVEERPAPTVTEKVVPETVWEEVPLSPMHLNGYEAPEEPEPVIEEAVAVPEVKNDREEIEQISISEAPLSLKEIEELEPDDLDSTFDRLELELGDLGDQLFSDLLEKPEEPKPAAEPVTREFINHPIEEILDNRPEEKEEEISLFDELFKFDKEQK